MKEKGGKSGSAVCCWFEKLEIGLNGWNHENIKKGILENDIILFLISWFNFMIILCVYCVYASMIWARKRKREREKDEENVGQTIYERQHQYWFLFVQLKL